jgi:hypothetical protein
MNVKLRIVHFGGRLIKVMFLTRTLVAVLMELIGKVTSLDDEVIICESQCGRFEVTLFVTVRPSQRFVSVVIIGMVLMLGNRRLVL